MSNTAAELTGLSPASVFPQLDSRGGVYAIFNTANGKSYLGSTNDFKARKRSHFGNLKSNRHSNRHLQMAWNRCEGVGFEFVILERVPDDLLLTEEDKYIKGCQTFGNGGYNLAESASKGMHSEEARQRISEARKGKAQRPKGFNMSEEQKAAIGDANRGRKMKLEHVEANRQRALARGPASEATRAKLSAASLGRKMPPKTEEWKRAHSERMKGRIASPETRAMMSLSASKRKHTEESKVKMRESWVIRKAAVSP